jgi:ATP-binding protein involved in chromosome partitioning
MEITLSAHAVREALGRVREPELNKDLVSLGMVKELTVEGGRVSFAVELTTPACPLKEKIQAECEAVVRSLPGVTAVNVTLTHRVGSTPAAPGREVLPGVKNVIAVYACKGGVGKTTVAVNLAASLALDGCAVGLFDADIHGPNVPLMTGATGSVYAKDGKMLPLQAHGMKLMSWGFVADENKPSILRGPMVHGAVRQLLRDTLWGELDYLIVDLPPGTGDAPLTLIQSVPLAGVVAVTTPQKAALADGIKGIGMFRKFYVPILGLVENMAGFICPHCGKDAPLFQKGGGEAEARRLGVPLVASIPLDPEVAQAGEDGTPLVIGRPRSPQAQALRWMAKVVAGRLSVIQREGEPAPAGA